MVSLRWVFNFHPTYEFSVDTVDLPVLIETAQKTSTAPDELSSISQSWPIGAVAPWLGPELVHKKQNHDCI